MCATLLARKPWDIHWGASRKIFLVEKERHTGDKVSILVQVTTITAAGNWGPGQRVSREGVGGVRDGELRTSRHTMGRG